MGHPGFMFASKGVPPANGTFYGMAAFGGLYFDGTLFSLDVGLAPFAITVPTSGKIGQKAMILRIESHRSYERHVQRRACGLCRGIAWGNQRKGSERRHHWQGRSDNTERHAQ
jgi:hypothetical protein